MSAAPLFTLVIFYFHEGRQHNIDDVCVKFCFILELIYSSDFHEGHVDACVEFCFLILT